MGIVWRGIIHDISKFRLDEFIPYARYFYGGPYPEKDSLSPQFGMEYNPLTKERVKREFDKAFLLHIHRNPHHWQYHILIDEGADSKTKIFQMPYKYMIEMVCDWKGAGKAITGNSNPLEWYAKYKDIIILEEYTRSRVEEIIGYKNEHI